MAKELSAYGDKLTPTQIKVLSLVARAYTSEQIAEELGISIPTAHYHIFHLYKKICTGTKHNRVEATILYWYSDL